MYQNLVKALFTVLVLMLLPAHVPQVGEGPKRQTGKTFSKSTFSAQKSKCKLGAYAKTHEFFTHESLLAIQRVA